ncbi:lipocalin-like domain-containing protein [Ferrimonas marina]|uniref:Predicted secreted hydrolase n=1 Tax=Ferrimonas marina TaxID=299255 RepID=A0A1M5YDW0_9GAMM|nr:lipocalin-like domain-containing protein [Ferrimonas marina]SHI10217.1 Predicted secreted hydrolase [Ferrimonas marina]
MSDSINIRQWIIYRVTILLALTLLAGCQQSQEDTALESSLGKSLGAKVEPGRTLSFPQDHGAHNDYGIEWWYLTANLKDRQGRDHGVQWTLFRFRGEQDTADNPWWQGQWYMGHLAWSPPQQVGEHRAWERWGRGGVGAEQQAGVLAQPFSAWIDDWQLQSREAPFLPLNLVAGEDDFRMALVLGDSPQVRHGKDGYSQKSADGNLASFYYSYPMLKVSGHLKGPDGWFEVSGEGWLDREWSSQFLDKRYQGWDWLSAHLDGGDALMLFCMRPSEGQDPKLRHCEGSLIAPDGSLQALKPEQIQWRATRWSSLDSGRFPVAFELGLPDRDWQMTVETLSEDQRNQLAFPYWEGPVRLSGSRAGIGFIEMTGYENR